MRKKKAKHKSIAAHTHIRTHTTENKTKLTHNPSVIGRLCVVAVGTGDYAADKQSRIFASLQLRLIRCGHMLEHLVPFQQPKPEGLRLMRGEEKKIMKKRKSLRNFWGRWTCCVVCLFNTDVWAFRWCFFIVSSAEEQIAFVPVVNLHCGVLVHFSYFSEWQDFRRLVFLYLEWLKFFRDADLRSARLRPSAFTASPAKCECDFAGFVLITGAILDLDFPVFRHLHPVCACLFALLGFAQMGLIALVRFGRNSIAHPFLRVDSNLALLAE